MTYSSVTINKCDSEVWGRWNKIRSPQTRGRSQEIITLGTVWKALKSAALSVGNLDQESVRASVQVTFTLMCIELQKNGERIKMVVTTMCSQLYRAESSFPRSAREVRSGPINGER